MLVIQSGFVKILKHSDRSSLQVTEGSKMIPLVCLASSLLVFRVLVRQRPSQFPSARVGFIFEAMRLILSWASSAHAFGSLHPVLLSWTHSLHAHCGPHRCVWFWVGSRSRADICSRSATFVAAWLFSRHIEATLVIRRGSAAMWYQADSWFFSFIERLMAARFTLCFLATVIILIMSLFRPFVHLSFVGISQAWRNGFPLALLHVLTGANVLIIRSITAAHVGLKGEKYR